MKLLGLMHKVHMDYDIDLKYETCIAVHAALHGSSGHLLVPQYSLLETILPGQNTVSNLACVSACHNMQQ